MLDILDKVMKITETLDEDCNPYILEQLQKITKILQ